MSSLHNHKWHSGTCVLVSLGCYDKLPYTGWLINSSHFFLTVLETGKSPSRHQQMQGLVRACILVYKCHSLNAALCGKSEEAFWGLFYKGLTTQSRPKGPISKHHHIGCWDLTYGFEEGRKHAVCASVLKPGLCDCPVPLSCRYESFARKTCLPGTHKCVTGHTLTAHSCLW